MIVYPTIFEEMSNDEIKEARKYLSKPIKAANHEKSKRIFNLDGAKLLLASNCDNSE